MSQHTRFKAHLQVHFLARPLWLACTLSGVLAFCCPLTLAAHAGSFAPRPAVPAGYGTRSHSVTASSASTAAQAHWQAITQGDLPRLMENYSPDAVFHWKEGAFEGDHVGTDAIRTVWAKFTKVRSPLTLTVSRLQENRGQNDSRVVTADVTFRNTDWTYALAYRLVFRKGQIVEETWQLAEPDADPGPV